MPFISNGMANLDVVVDDFADLTNPAEVPNPQLGQRGYVDSLQTWFWFDGANWQVLAGGAVTEFTGDPVSPNNNINAAATSNLIDFLNVTAGSPNVSSYFTAGIDQTEIVAVRAMILGAYGQISFQGAAARYNGRAFFQVNGVPNNRDARMGYIRNATGHDESSLVWRDQFNVAIGDVIQMRVDRESAQALAVTLDANSVLCQLTVLGVTG